MRLFIPLRGVLPAAQISPARNTFRITARDHETKQPVVGARVSVKGTEISSTTGAGGAAGLAGGPDGEQTVEVFSVGYETEELKVSFPLQGGPRRQQPDSARREPQDSRRLRAGQFRGHGEAVARSRLPARPRP